MLKGRGREARDASSPASAQFNMRPPTLAQPRTPLPQRQPIKPEPDYEVVEFPSDQYVNAKLQPPPPPPPRPPTGHPVQAGASCGLCGGGGARVRCAECGRRALCASCDDMYHRHPKRRHHQRQALSPSQLSEDRPPLPPKTVLTAPVPPPRRHKMSASPKPPMQMQDPRRATLNNAALGGVRPQPAPAPMFNHPQPLPIHIQNKIASNPNHIGSMPFLNTMPHQAAPVHPQMQSNTLGHLNSAWNRPRGSLQGFNMPQMAVGSEAWESPESLAPSQQSWGRPMRRGASVLELGGTGAGAGCAGCAHCAPVAWRYGSCASLDHPWATPGAAWPAPAPAPACCAPPHHAHAHQHAHHHPPQTPQPYRRGDSRTLSRAASRTGSRAASPALSVRSRASRRTKHRTPSPPPLPSSDADSESESDEEPPPPARRGSRAASRASREPPEPRAPGRSSPPAPAPPPEPDALGPAPPPPAVAWQCEHCTYVNEAGVRVCAVCCRTPTAAPRVLANELQRLHIVNDSAPAPASVPAPAPAPSPALSRVRESPRVEVPATEKSKRTESIKSTKERTSTGCGPSPPRERGATGKATPRLITPTRENGGGAAPAVERPRSRHDMAVGPSPPRDQRDSHRNATAEVSPQREFNKTVRVSPYRETKEIPKIITPQRHSAAVGPSPPREVPRRSAAVGPSPPREEAGGRASTPNFQKKSAGTSPLREVPATRTTAPITKTNVSNTGTSPPPQSISTQTYEDPSTWERAGGGGGGGGGAGAVRSRRRFRDDARRERSHSRHSLSSDTRESERSVRTVGGGSWEWRERDVSPPSVGEWGGRLARRASHLDLRRTRPVQRRTSFYGSEAASPEPPSARTLSLEALAGGPRARDSAGRGLELARLLADAERLGFDAAEVQVALSAAPDAPLEWLRSRWAGLAGAVRGAAARLAPHAPLSEREARAALARHRGAVWPAVTECVDALRRQTDSGRVSSAARVRGRVWGSPAGADDDAAAPRERAEYSSDEYDPPPAPYAEDEWLPPAAALDGYELEEPWGSPPPLPPAAAAPPPLPYGAEEVARTLCSLLVRAGVPAVDESSLLRGLLGEAGRGAGEGLRGASETGRGAGEAERDVAGGPPSFDLIQSENDFIDAYNALTRASPLPNIDRPPDTARLLQESSLSSIKTDHDYSRRDDEMQSEVDVNGNANDLLHKSKKQLIANTLKAPTTKTNIHSKNEPKKAKIKILKTNDRNVTGLLVDQRNANIANSTKDAEIGNQTNEIKSPAQLSDSQQSKQAEDKSKNLNDIVDNTQRLIQQMKDEINSDINSLDDEHAQTSQSEHETSSNDEREESSYSDTEEETDNMTSDEKEISTEGEYEEEEISKNDAAFPNRTSSEDNEQFEEALDNLDNQIEDVKHVNIEILDSITRSLQEEHTISIEVNETKTENFKKEQVAMNGSKDSKYKNEDSNNNLFVTVNSFDEIYAELNHSIDSRKQNIQTEPPKPLQANYIKIIPPVETKILHAKHAVNELTLKLVTPTKLLISENRDPIFNGILNTIEVSQESEEQIGPETTQEELANGAGVVNDRSSSESATSQSKVAYNEDVVNGISNSASETAHENIANVELVVNERRNSESETKQREVTNLDIVVIDRSSSESETTKRERVRDELVINKRTNSESENIQSATANVELVIKESPKSQNVQNEIANEAQMSSGRSSSESSTEPDESNPSQNNDIEGDTENTLTIKTTEIILIPTENKNITNEPNQNKPNSHSEIEKLKENPTNDNNIQKIVTVKSSIPKPIKPTQNIKAKVDKLAPKLIVSKVPVRKTSMKQYPAPPPPKTHFGNVQIGHVKQLQSKIFNNEKSAKPPAPVTVDVKPSTSTATLTKKKPAPQPPAKQSAQKQPTPPKSSPPKEKRNNYFRETCRTEDEWTDSDSEDSQSQVVKPTESKQEELFSPSPPSPPPSVTVRRVSGNIIDLAEVQLPEGSPERQARMLLAGGAMETWEQARLAVELVSRGAAPPAALLAALECADLPAALAYLHQDCELCASRLPEHEMVSMLRCTHRCCRECARLYFTVQVTERSIADCVCPYCKLPELEALPEDAWLEYFAHLDILLKTLLDVDTHELFQRKLRDRTLARDPNFRWCMECSSGFFVHPKQKKLRCPECRSVTCASCRRPWSANHEGLSCEQYAAWLDDNDPERAAAAVHQHLRENGLECPRCRFKYSLSRGGCMHFTCTQCKYEFCYGCGKPFTMGARCGLSDYCAKLGLHAHHPRNCLFYLRDKEPHELQTLLQMNNVAYETQPAEGGAGRCPIQLQRETPAGLVDGVCGSEAPPNYAGLCKPHYVEYLAGLARALDPIPIMDVAELVAELRRRALPLPERGPWDTDPVYAGMCAEIVREKIPLE